jgi:phospholipase C
MLVISPLAKQGHLDPTIYDHGSVLKFIERVFKLPTLASMNHQFDHHTPGNPPGGNDAAHGKEYGPPAPPRDGSRVTGDLSNTLV